MNNLEETNVESNLEFYPYELIINRRKEKKIGRIFDWAKFADFLVNLSNPPLNVLIGINKDFAHTKSYAIKDGKILLKKEKTGHFFSYLYEPIFTFDQKTGYHCFVNEGETNYKYYTFWPEQCLTKVISKWGFACQ